MSTIIKGDELQVWLYQLGSESSFYCPMYATSHTVTLSGNTVDIATKDHGFWGASSIGSITWELSAECLLTQKDYDYLFNAMVNRTRLQCIFAPVHNYSVNGLTRVGGDVSSWLYGAIGKRGYVCITSMTVNANTGENASYSITFTGQGALKKYDLTTNPFKVQVKYDTLFDSETGDGVELFNLRAKDAIAAVRVGSDGSPANTILDMNGSNVYPLTAAETPNNPYIEFTLFGTVVPEYMFKDNTHIRDVSLSNNINEIEEYAFAGSRIQSITYEAPRVNIKHHSFNDCNFLEAINVYKGASYLNAGYIGNNAFSSCVRLTSIVVGDQCRSILAEAFSNCIGLTTAKGGDSLANIGPNAFLAHGQRDITIYFNTGQAPNIAENSLGNPTMLTVALLNSESANVFTNNFTISGWDQYEPADGTTYIIPY